MTQLPEELSDYEGSFVHIGIVAIGGAGIAMFKNLGPHSCRSVAIDLNQLTLDRSNADHTILVGNGQLRPKRSDRVRFLARSAEAEIQHAVEGLDLVFLVCGLGGMAGSYISPFVADVLRRLNILTTAVVAIPFPFEGASRHVVARKALASLRACVDVVLPLRDEYVQGVEDESLRLDDAVQKRSAAFNSVFNGISRPLCSLGIVGLDFEDMRLVLSQIGQAGFRYVEAGEGVRLIQAAQDAIESLVKDSPEGFKPKGLFVSFGLRKTDKFREIAEVMNLVRDHLGEESLVLFGAVFMPEPEPAEILFVVTGL